MHVYVEYRKLYLNTYLILFICSYFGDGVRYSFKTLVKIFQAIAEGVLGISHQHWFINLDVSATSFDQTKEFLVDAANQVLSKLGLIQCCHELSIRV